MLRAKWLDQVIMSNIYRNKTSQEIIPIFYKCFPQNRGGHSFQIILWNQYWFPWHQTPAKVFIRKPDINTLHEYWHQYIFLAKYSNIKIMHDDQMGFISWMQDCFSTWKSINLIYHINRIKDKQFNHLNRWRKSTF